MAPEQEQPADDRRPPLKMLIATADLLYTEHKATWATYEQTFHDMVAAIRSESRDTLSENEWACIRLSWQGRAYQELEQEADQYWSSQKDSRYSPWKPLIRLSESTNMSEVAAGDLRVGMFLCNRSVEKILTDERKGTDRKLQLRIRKEVIGAIKDHWPITMFPSEEMVRKRIYQILIDQNEKGIRYHERAKNTAKVAVTLVFLAGSGCCSAVAAKILMNILESIKLP